MRVNNNYTSPNFGMALKIKSCAMESLKDASMETLNSIEKIGRDLKDTKYFDMEIGSELKAAITTPSGKVLYKGDYFGVEEPNSLDRIYIRTLFRDEDARAGITYDSPYDAQRAYARLTAPKTYLETVAAITKELDNMEIEKIKKTNTTAELDKKVEAKAEDLYSRFGKYL